MAFSEKQLRAMADFQLLDWLISKVRECERIERERQGSYQQTEQNADAFALRKEVSRRLATCPPNSSAQVALSVGEFPGDDKYVGL
jgi:hypothetical protein